MLFDPTVRNVNPFLIRTGIRTMRKLVLALTIHDKDVTMAKPARANFTVRTGLALPYERRMRPKTHRNNELCVSLCSQNSGTLSLCQPTCEKLHR